MAKWLLLFFCLLSSPLHAQIDPGGDVATVVADGSDVALSAGDTKIEPISPALTDDLVTYGFDRSSWTDPGIVITLRVETSDDDGSKWQTRCSITSAGGVFVDKEGKPINTKTTCNINGKQNPKRKIQATVTASKAIDTKILVVTTAKK